MIIYILCCLYHLRREIPDNICVSIITINTRCCNNIICALSSLKGGYVCHIMQLGINPTPSVYKYNRVSKKLQKRYIFFHVQAESKTSSKRAGVRVCGFFTWQEQCTGGVKILIEILFDVYNSFDFAVDCGGKGVRIFRQFQLVPQRIHELPSDIRPAPAPGRLFQLVVLYRTRCKHGPL